MTHRDVNNALVKRLNVPAVHLGPHEKPLLRGDIVVEINDINQISSGLEDPFQVFQMDLGNTLHDVNRDVRTWTIAASELWVAGQRAMPGWARGRMNATIIMAAQGAMALGGFMWGSSVSTWGVTSTLLAAFALQLASLVLQFWLSIDFTGELHFEPAPVAGSSFKLIHIPAPYDGPVSIHIDFEVDRTHGKEFLEAIREVRLIHLGNGAFSWRLHEDLGRPNTYRIEVIVPSWTEYLLEQERMTTGEQNIVDKAWALHVGEKPPETRHFLCVNRELHTRHHPVTRPSAMPEAPLSVDRVES